MASPRLELSSLPSECPLQRSGSTDSGLDSPTQDDTEGTYDPFASPAADEAEEEEEEEAGEEEDPSCWNIDDLSGWHGEERDMQGFSLPARTSDGSIPPADEQSDHRPEVLQAPSRDARLGVSRVAQTPLSGGPGMLLHAAAACESESWGREARRAPIAFGPDEPDPTTSDVDGNDQESREDADSRLGSPITNSNTDPWSIHCWMEGSPRCRHLSRSCDLLTDSGFVSAVDAENSEDSVSEDTNRCSREVKRLSLYKKSAASAERELRSVECDRRDQLPLGSHAAAAAAASSSSSQLTTAACAAAPETAAGSSVGSSVGSSAGHGQQMRARLAVSPLRTETRTDHEARASLEQARGHVSHDCELMTQKITKLSHQLKVNQEHQRDLSSELSKKNSMMHEYLNINSTLQETTIDLQRALTDTTLGNCRLQEEVRSLSESNARGLRELQECEARLRTAQRRGQTLQLQVEACQAANESVIRETTRRLYGEYYAQLTQQESQHRTHVADFLARQMEYEARLQRADEAREDTERTLAESQRRSRELERLLSGLQDERELFLRRQEEVESELSLIQARPSGSQGEKKRCEQLEGEVACLHEKIRHLNGIIISQDRKIKGVLEKVERLQWELQQKDAMISNLQQKVATLEAENAALKRRLEEQSRAAKTSERSTPNLSIPSYQPHLPPALTRRQWSVESSSENGDSPLARLRKLRASRIQPGPGSKEAERND
ncbi:uncharacterized protein LOC116942216 isoform X2 [Petromyzon marinus]|uniref:uncharacterized protein LOC116942216 isoform X2 n=1 Tax=Petromyzon marinus TaxID=7757 RepID=UPI003F6F3FD6